MKINSVPVQEVMSKYSDLTVQKKDETSKVEELNKEEVVKNKEVKGDLGTKLDILV